MKRICPKRDMPCPHGMSCPFVIDRYKCKPEPTTVQPSCWPPNSTKHTSGSLLNLIMSRAQEPEEDGQFVSDESNIEGNK